MSYSETRTASLWIESVFFMCFSSSELWKVRFFGISGSGGHPRRSLGEGQHERITRTREGTVGHWLLNLPL